MHEVALVEGWVELELLGHRIHHGELAVRRLAPEQGSPLLLELRTPAIDDCEATFHNEFIGRDDKCDLPRGHDGDHQGLPF